MQDFFSPIIPAVKEHIPQSFMTAAETFLSHSAFTGHIGHLPRALQSAVAIFTLLIFIWGGAHVVFLLVTFIRNARTNLQDAFTMTVVPTLAISSLLSSKTEQSHIHINNANTAQLQLLSDTSKQQSVQSSAKLSSSLVYHV